MSKHRKPTDGLALLLKWRFVPGRHGAGGQARYWWSDGTRTDEDVPSYIQAVTNLSRIQDQGGCKPDDIVEAMLIGC